MDKLQEMSSFVAVVDAGSFVRGAEATGQSKAAVSRHVGELESRLGTRLMQRTTRRLSLTAEGQAFYTRCRELLAAVEEAEAELTASRSEPSGLVRVNAPLTYGILRLAPLWGRFMSRHPKVTLDVTLTDRVVDLVEEGYDLAVRISTLSSATLVSRRLATTRLRLCASPEYLKRYGRLKHPRDLAEHRVIAYSYLATPDAWQFVGPDGAVSVRIKPCLFTNNGDTCRSAALDHQGIVLQPDFLVGEDLRRGALQEPLPAYRANELGIYAVYPTRKYLPLKTRMLIDFLAAALGTGRARAAQRAAALVRE
jgi:DNA-binding transcriptional LysR family regulator